MSDSTCTFLESDSEEHFDRSAPAMEFLIVLVGDDGVSFSVDQRILRSTTGLAGLGLDENNCRIPQVRPKVFGLFHAWLHGRLDASLSECPNDWIELHIFAATYSIVKLQDDLMDMVQDLFLLKNSLVMSRGLVDMVFVQDECTVRALRKWCVAMKIRALKEDHCSTKDLALLLQHPSFAKEFSKYLYHAASNPLGIYLFEDPRTRIVRDYDEEYLRLPVGFPRCYFHCHGQGECAASPIPGRREGSGMVEPVAY